MLIVIPILRFLLIARPDLAAAILVTPTEEILLDPSKEIRGDKEKIQVGLGSKGSTELVRDPRFTESSATCHADFLRVHVQFMRQPGTH